MKIAQISAVFPPYKGGIGQVAWQYSQGLWETKEQVEVFTINYGIQQKYNFPCHYLLAWPRWGKAGFAPQIFFKLDKFDIVQLHYPAFGLAEIVGLWKFFNKKKKLFIFYHHDVVGRGFLKYFFWFYQRIILPWLVGLADIIQVSSLDYVKNSDLQNFIKNKPEKFIALPFGADNTFVSQVSSEDNEKNILFVGGLDRNHYFKGLNVLLDACAQLQTTDWKLLVVGDGDLRADLEDYALSLGLGDKVIFYGNVSNEDLLSLYNKAYVFCLPSIDKSEAFGIVLVEAMATGCAVIASDLPGVRSVVSKDVGWLVQPGDSKALTAKLDFVLASPAIVELFGHNASQEVENKYRWPTIINSLKELYRI